MSKSKPWIVQWREGWCALPVDTEPDPEALNDLTLCGWVVIMRWQTRRGKPDCPECLALLAAMGRLSERTNR